MKQHGCVDALSGRILGEGYRFSAKQVENNDPDRLHQNAPGISTTMVMLSSESMLVMMMVVVVVMMMMMVMLSLAKMMVMTTNDDVDDDDGDRAEPSVSTFDLCWQLSTNNEYNTSAAKDEDPACVCEFSSSEQPFPRRKQACKIPS